MGFSERRSADGAAKSAPRTRGGGDDSWDRGSASDRHRSTECGSRWRAFQPIDLAGESPTTRRMPAPCPRANRGGGKALQPLRRSARKSGGSKASAGFWGRRSHGDCGGLEPGRRGRSPVRVSAWISRGRTGSWSRVPRDARPSMHPSEIGKPNRTQNFSTFCCSVTKARRGFPACRPFT